MNRLPRVFLRDFHILAEQWERAAWCRLCYASSDPQKSVQYLKEAQSVWEEMERTRKVMEEAIKDVKEGKKIDSRVIMF